FRSDPLAVVEPYSFRRVDIHPHQRTLTRVRVFDLDQLVAERLDGRLQQADQLVAHQTAEEKKWARGPIDRQQKAPRGGFSLLSTCFHKPRSPERIEGAKCNRWFGQRKPRYEI